MSSRPQVSVVMGVRNGARKLDASIESIVQQSFTDWELLIVDDGSTDDTPAAIDRWAEKEVRIRRITIPHGGLTRALIRGCEEARGEYIARMDCGDRSYPRRLELQTKLLDEQPDVVLASCSVALVDADGELLQIVRLAPDIRRLLSSGDARTIRSIPAHSSAFFRRDAYLKTGGYCPEFYFAQDLELWTRMASLGRVAGPDEVLVELEIDPSSITSIYRDHQAELTAIIVQLRNASTTAEKKTLLSKASGIGPSRQGRHARGAGYYFLGSMSANTVKRRRYFRMALEENRFHWKAALRLLQESLRNRKTR